jgi:hypothetical protein
LDGVLVQNGILVEYFSNDNLLGEPFLKRVVSETENLFRPSTYDRYSFRALTYVKAPYSETYYFTARSGTSVFVNNKVIIENGGSGIQFISAQVWTLIEV